MALVPYSNNPTTTDTVLFDLFTTDLDGNLIDPYKVDRVTIFFVERDYTTKQYFTTQEYVAGEDTQFVYKDAVPFKVYGSDTFPAWLSSDTSEALLLRLSTGHFQLEWVPELAREGDYFVCYAWTPIPAGDTYAQTFYFKLAAASNPPSPPNHRTPPHKYDILLDRYTPEMFKLMLGSGDLSPDVIQRLNQAIAMGFTDLEDLVCQISDLQDANTIRDIFLPYMANFFRWKLRSQDPILWRRQCRRAIPLYKKKGTIGGLKEALSESAITFKKLTYYWQVVSKSTWQEGFVFDGNCSFRLSKKPLLPNDHINFKVSYRKKDTFNYVDFAAGQYGIVPSSTTNDNCPPGTDDYATLIINHPYCDVLDDGDIVRVLYKVAEPDDQAVESYIQTLPLADNRDEVVVTYPAKNWNVRLIAEDDPMFSAVCPVRHPFQYPVVWGKLRTEFPYGENIYNMDEYNGSIRDSENPCDIDASFYDVCSCCRSSKVSVDVAIEELSNDRIVEASEIIRDFLPFHSPLHSINYVGFRDELIPPPLEEIECLVRYELNDNIILSQFDFNRIIEDGKSDDAELKRNMLATSSAAAAGSDGFGVNLKIVMTSYGYDFSTIGVGTNNLLEILTGSYAGDYSLTSEGEVIGLTAYPLSPSGFTYRLSNNLFTESGVSIYQDNIVKFTSSDSFLNSPIPDDGTWSLRINSNTYPITAVDPGNFLHISGWTSGSSSNLAYDLLAPGNVVVLSGTTGTITVSNVGRLEASPVQDEWNVRHGDYILIGSTQYRIISIEQHDTSDHLFLDGWTGGDQVGTVSYTALHRLIDNGYGSVAFKGMKLTTTANYESVLGIQNGQNPPVDIIDNSDFKENYLILIDTQYYQMADIDGNDIYLSGPILGWGLSGTSGINYTLIHFEKIPFTTQNGTSFTQLDRRGEGTIVVEEIDEEAMPMALRMQMLNRINNGEVIEDSIKETVQTKEEIWFTVRNKE